MTDQPMPTPLSARRNPMTAMLLPWVLIGHFLWNFLTPAHEFPLRTGQVPTMTFDCFMLAGLIALKDAMPKPSFWVALLAGIGLFSLRLSSDGWWTGHLAYSLPPR